MRGALPGIALTVLAACGGTASSVDARDPDAPTTIDAAPSDAAPDGPASACAPFGAPGDCITTTACAGLGDHTSYPGYCPGPTDIQCCIVTPSTANNPPIPTGYRLMKQSEVTAEMTTWAIDILHDPVTYPMFATTTRTFGALDVLARVQWHPPDFNNSAIHRGVTLFVPL
ncbi:MAG: hypothetical protein K8W52_33860 [Deltaproteobacteria bacterium]|nr:hypothetical protein [Deltaproteobacteria bacterium]